MNTIPQLYGPDGVPLAGPITTAAQEAEFLADPHPLNVSYRAQTFIAWREAADREGGAWAHALREGRALIAGDLRPDPDLVGSGSCDVCAVQYAAAADDHCGECGTCWEHCPKGHAADAADAELARALVDYGW